MNGSEANSGQQQQQQPGSSCRWNSEDEVGMRELVAKCNEDTKQGKEQLRQVTQRRKSQATIALPPSAAAAATAATTSTSSYTNVRGRPIAREVRR
jgi:hypothetical protein